MARRKSYWLVKSEPEVYSIGDLERDGSASWDGVRNYQARNFLRDAMRAGDLVLFYHSSSRPSGVAGVARVCREAYPDLTARNPTGEHYDPRASPQNPVWYAVDVEFVERFERLVPLHELKEDGALEGMLVRRRGQRLSVQPVEPAHFRRVLHLGRKAPPTGDGAETGRAKGRRRGKR